MFDLQKVLDQRLAALKGKKKKSQGDDSIELNDTSVEYIKRSLTQAGILDKKGNVRKFDIQ